MKKVARFLVVMVLMSLLIGCAASMTYKCPTGSAIAIFPSVDQTKVICGIPKAGKTLKISVRDMEMTGELNIPANVQIEFFRHVEATKKTIDF